MSGRLKIATTEQKSWLRLDNAAKIFPVTTNRVRTHVFRLSVELTQRVKLKELQLAYSETLDELPYFRSQLKKGFFWYWLEPSEAKPLVQQDKIPPCRAFKTGYTNHLLMRILAKNNMIAAEFMHVLCDASGGMQFLRSLLRNYGKHCGWGLDPVNHPMDADQASMEELYEDSYQKYFNKYLPKPARISRAYHLPFSTGLIPEYKATTLQMATKDAIALSRKYNVTLTEYLASVYLFILQGFYLRDLQHSKVKRTVLRIELPVNLRNLFPSRTLRNFSLFVMPEIDPKLGEYSFEEITSVVHHYMRLETDKRQIKRIIRRNVGSEKNLMVRAIPLFLKVPILTIAYKSFGPPLYSLILTNIGKVEIPDDCSKYITRFRFVPPPPDPKLKMSSALISYKDKLVLCFGNQSNSFEFEKEVIRFLQNEGLNLKILNP